MGSFIQVPAPCLFNARTAVGCFIMQGDVLGGCSYRFFPFERLREGQRQFLNDAHVAVRDGKHLLAYAPTGLGKTAVALSTALEAASSQNRLVLFLTSRQSQHRIAVETLRRIKTKFPNLLAVDVISKRAMCLQSRAPRSSSAFQEFCNYMVRSRRCRFYNQGCESVAPALGGKVLHAQELRSTCASFDICPHATAMEAGKRSNVIVCDYNYVFSSLQDRILARLERPLSEIILIVDEAHNLPDRIRGQVNSDLTPSRLNRVAKEVREMSEELSAALMVLSSAFDEIVPPTETGRKVGANELEDWVSKTLGSRFSGLKSLSSLKAALLEAGRKLTDQGRDSTAFDLVRFIETWSGGEQEVTRLAVADSEPRLFLRLLDPALLSRDIFGQVHSSILMSGTLHPPEMYADLLGIDKDRHMIGVYASPFPRENRPVYLNSGLTTLYEKRSERLYQSIAAELTSALRAIPGNVAVFFPSYELLGQVLERLKMMPIKKRLLVERSDWDKARRDQALERLRDLKPKGGVALLGVLGGSFSEGVDFRDNLLSGVVIVGLPVAPPSLQLESLKEFYESRYGPQKARNYAYLFPAINKILQAAGRCIRSERDRAVVLILESRLAEKRFAEHLPPDFRCLQAKNISSEVRRFFYTGQNLSGDVGETGSRGAPEAPALARSGSG